MRFQLQQSSRAELIRVLKVLNQALEPRTFLVGESITLADMAVTTAVLLPFKYVRMFYNTLLSYRFSHLIADQLRLSTFDCAINHSDYIFVFFLGVGAIRQEGLDQCYQVVHNLHKSATVPEGVGEDHSL